MNWRIKGLVQYGLSRTGAGRVINDCLQRTLGGLRDLDATIDSKVVDDWLPFARHVRAGGLATEGIDVFEVGTGWFPTLPLCFSLAGARRCITFDVAALLDERLTLRMLRRLERHLETIADASGRSRAAVQAEYRRLKDCANGRDILRTARIEYHGGRDAANSGLPEESVGLAYSNSVLEHVKRIDVCGIFSENRRIVKSDGLVIHSINCGDHYAYFDRRITPINYLRYSDRQWRLWNNDLQYQNRLRPSDFAQLAEAAGLKVVECIFKPRAELMERLPTMRIASQFAGYPAEQLCSTSVDVIARAG